jgi:hypothetical protein
MKGHYPYRQDFEKAGQGFHTATREHYTIWFTGETERWKKAEVMLPRLVKLGKLVAHDYSKKLVYTVPRRCRGILPNIEHGLGCTEGLVRFWRSDMNCRVIPEQRFKGFKVVPEWGLLYPTGKLLLYEFSTRDNAMRSGLISRKVHLYEKYLADIEKEFTAQATVVFVLDIPREKIRPEGDYFFTDYQSFKSVPIGWQLTVTIYLWGRDGQAYSLRKYDQPILYQRPTLG